MRNVSTAEWLSCALWKWSIILGIVTLEVRTLKFRVHSFYCHYIGLWWLVQETGSDHVAGEGLSHPSAIAHMIIVTSIQLCISQFRVFSFVFYGMRRPCNNLVYHFLPKGFYILFKRNVFEVIFYHWHLIRSWKQIRLLYSKWTPIFVMVWSAPFYYEHLESAAVAGVLQRKL